MLQRKLDAGGTTKYDVQVRNKAGAWLFWEINSGLLFQDGAPIGLHVVGRDVTERKKAETRQQLLIDELNHRVKNTLAIVQALAQQSLKGGRPPAEERATFEARLSALAAAHNLLTNAAWQAAVSFALTIHELCTNAIKYGALSNDSGTISIQWHLEGSGHDPVLLLVWTEQGGPAVQAPLKRGFGTRMIERALASDLKARVQISFEEQGVVCSLSAPVSSMSA
jgi:two-component sensor histidine kinase